MSPACSAFRVTESGNCDGIARTCTLPSVDRMARMPKKAAPVRDVAGGFCVEGHHLMARMSPYSVPITVQSLGFRFIAMVRMSDVDVGLVGKAQIWTADGYGGDGWKAGRMFSFPPASRLW